MDPAFYREPGDDPDCGLTDEELAEWYELETRMEACSEKNKHNAVGEDGCLECGYGSK